MEVYRQQRTLYVGGNLLLDYSSPTGAGAVPVSKSTCFFTSSGSGQALSLANGTVGQVLKVVYISEGAGSDDAKLTPTTALGISNFDFLTVGNTLTLIYTSNGWATLSNIGGAIN